MTKEEVVASASPAQQDDIYYAYSVDYDSCLSAHLIQLLQDAAYNKEKVLASLSQPLIAHLRALVDKRKPNQQSLYLGSARQCPISNRGNLDRHKNGCAFTALEALAGAILGLDLQKLLLIDVFNRSLLEGENWRADYTKLCKKGDRYLGGFGARYFDAHKILLLYAQMHDAALKADGKPVHFEFYDDRDDILSNLQLFFEGHKELLPANITLKLNRYKSAEGEVKEYATIKSNPESQTDLNYADSLHFLAAQAKHTQGKYLHLPTKNELRMQTIHAEEYNERMRQTFLLYRYFRRCTPQMNIELWNQLKTTYKTAYEILPLIKQNDFSDNLVRVLFTYVESNICESKVEIK